MTAQHAPLRASGLPRLLGVLALLAGIIAMHAGVFAIPGDHHMAAAVTTAMPADDHGTVATGTDCGSDGCGDSHGGMHACVFILTAVGLALILVLLYRVTVDRPHLDAAALRNSRPRRERAPPWTVPSLAELSILRI
ncbi:DUF6153 family protein [Nocardia sp. NBC_01009]|uniref:DUF6153 family protein n=1 Tax=Nocardia sp. NBC_01009 TaxID=2975996 RepID=UPI003866221C|nr:DUF6153 family protein [Nocardia sp. NBC_01009]